MKKSLLFLALLGTSAAAHSQILNAGFETTKPNSVSKPAHWGRTIGIPFPCTVQEGYDSVYFQTSDAHSGSYALELRNAHCDAIYFAGSAFAMQNDTNYFASGFPYTASPSAISFFYKLFPIGGDVGYVGVELWDDVNSTIVAESEIEIATGSAIGYQPASLPLIYSATTTPTRMTVAVGIRNNATTVHYGTRFLLDDFSETITSVGGPATPTALPVLSPNPATTSILSSEAGELTILDATGRIVLRTEVNAGSAVDVQKLPRGLYAYRLIGKNENDRRGMLVLQ